MRRYRLTGTALAASLLLLAGPSRVGAAPIAPASLLPALDVYVDAMAAGHAAAAACLDAKSPARNEGGWAQARAMFVATLWANGFPIVFVHTAAQRLAAPPPARPDCASAALAGEFGEAAGSGWPAAMRQTLAGMDLAVVANPVAPAVWTGLKALIGTDAAAEKRLLDCVAVVEPARLPPRVHAWDEMLQGLNARLLAAGLPRDEVNETMSAADADSLWHRAPPDAEAELRDSCARDQSWQQRLASGADTALAAGIARQLPAAPGAP